MDTNLNQSPSSAHPDQTMDFLSRAWCNFAVQAIQPHELQDRSIVLLDPPSKMFENDVSVPLMKMDQSLKVDDNLKSIPPWKSNHVNSWIWMQQAMHPELNYSSCFRKKWFVPWKIIPFKSVSIKKWLKEMRQSRKEEERLQRAEVHAAISVAGIAAALAAVAAADQKPKNDTKSSCTEKEAAVASAAALVAAQCAQLAEAMGAKREQLSRAICSAMSSTSVSDILTLTAAASTSLKGAATLQARKVYKNRLNGGVPVLPIEDVNSTDPDFNYGKYRSILAKGADLMVETPNGKYKVRSVSIIQNIDGKVILKVRELNRLKSKKESVVILDMHVELYKDDEDEDAGTSYLIVLTTSGGTFKLDMANDYEEYKTWTMTINHMLAISTSSTKHHELRLCSN